MEKSFEIGIGDNPPFHLLHFRKYIRSMGWSWISTALNFNQLIKSSILEFDNKTENYYNYNGAECPNTNWFWQIFIFFQNYLNHGHVNSRKRKGKRERITRRRIKSEFVCINWIQFIRLKIQKIINCSKIWCSSVIARCDKDDI